MPNITFDDHFFMQLLEGNIGGMFTSVTVPAIFGSATLQEEEIKIIFAEQAIKFEIATSEMHFIFE